MRSAYQLLLPITVNDQDLERRLRNRPPPPRGSAAKAAAPRSRSTRVVYAAIAANLAIATTKFVVATLSGSSAILSESVHSLVDTANQLLLLVGLKGSRRPPDEQFPFGYGRELYFWSLVVAILLFGAGGGVALYEGITHVIHPRPMDDAFWAYIVIGVAAIFEGSSFMVARHEIRKRWGEGSLWRHVHRSKDPSVFIVVLEDGAALIGLSIALAGVFLSQLLQQPRIDGVASVLIGIVLGIVAVALAYETRGLLIGESATTETVLSIRQLASQDAAVRDVHAPLTMHLGPEEVLLNLEVQFKAGASAQEQVQAVQRIERVIRDHHPTVKRIFIEATHADQS